MSINILSQQDEIFPDTVQRTVSLVLLRQSALFLSVPLEAAYIALLGSREPVCCAWGMQGYE